MEEKVTSGDIINDFQRTLDAAKDTQEFAVVKKELIAKAQLLTQGGYARELTEAIKEGPEAVDKVLKRYKKEVRPKQ